MTQNSDAFFAAIHAIPGSKQFSQGTAQQHAIRYIATDTRQIVYAAQTCFFALPGAHRHGAVYIPSAWQMGVRTFVTDLEVDVSALPGAIVWLVPDTLMALQQVATRHRNLFELPVIGITGSNGKTVIKEWLYQLLNHKFQVVRSPRSYNSQIGVPLSVWQIQDHHTLAIFEAGISQAGEMQALADMIRPTMGIFTNIGDAHNQGFESQAAKVAEKMKLFANVRFLVYCRDHEAIHQAVQQRGVTVFDWSRKEQARLQIVSEESSTRSGKTRIKALYQGKEISIRVPFMDAASLENAIHCWCVLLHLGLPPKQIQDRFQWLAPVAMRLELKEGINECLLIDDSYNNDIAALPAALEFTRKHAGGRPITVILSGYVESGLVQHELYGRISRVLHQYGVKRFIGIGLDGMATQLPLSVQTSFYPDTESLLQVLDDLPMQKEAILVKGARVYALERVAQALSRQVHQTVLEVNLGALATNMAWYKQQLKPQTRMMVMVKAAAYGSGSVEVATFLSYRGADYLSVAYTDEGVELREKGITLPIMVLNAEPDSVPLLVKHGLEPEVYAISQLRNMVRSLSAKKTPALTVHIKLDTGMHRLGFLPDDIPVLLEELQAAPFLHVGSLFSHLAASEDPTQDDFTHQQARRFREMSDQIVDKLGYRPMLHLVNSSGIERFPEYHFDMVRLGIGVYGMTDNPQLRPALSLKARISQVKTIQAGDTVSYGRRFTATQTMRIGIISLGYADGLPRLAGNERTALWTHGKLAPIIGTICMDMCMIDISQIPEAREGSEVVVFGEEMPVQRLAEAAQTIPYEIIAGLPYRIKRAYVQD